MPAPCHSTNPAAVLEDRPGIEVVAQVEELAVDHLDAVVGALEVAVQIALRQHEAFAGEMTAEQAVDARDAFSPALRRIVLRQRHQDPPSLFLPGT